MWAMTKGTRPMTVPPSAPSSQTIVVDASVAINLNASGSASQILRAHPGTFVVTGNVVGELGRCARTGRDDRSLAVALIAAGVLAQVTLQGGALNRFEMLTIGNSADTLDDGEAATIAYAAEVTGVALIDERKARRICAARSPSVPLLSTIDILREETVAKALGRDALRDAVDRALRHARMHVAQADRSWAVDLLGDELAAGHPVLRKDRRMALPALNRIRL